MMTTTLAKAFVALSLAFVILTAISGSAYYTVFGYVFLAVMVSAVLVNVIRKVRISGRRQLINA